MHREEIPLFCVEKFLSHSTETFRRETLLCFRKLLVSKNFMDKRGEGRDCHVFVRKIFCLTVPQNFLEELFCASEVFGYPKILWIRRGVSRFFTEIFFVSQCWKFLWGNPNVFQKFSGIKKLFVSEGGGGGLSPFFVESFSYHSADKFRKGNLQYFKKTRVPEKFRNMTREGVLPFAMEKLLYHRTKKFCRGTFLCFKTSGIEKI